MWFIRIGFVFLIILTASMCNAQTQYGQLHLEFDKTGSVNAYVSFPVIGMSPIFTLIGLKRNTTARTFSEGGPPFYGTIHRASDGDVQNFFVGVTGEVSESVGVFFDSQPVLNEEDVDYRLEMNLVQGQHIDIMREKLEDNFLPIKHVRVNRPDWGEITTVTFGADYPREMQTLQHKHIILGNNGAIRFEIKVNEDPVYLKLMLLLKENIAILLICLGVGAAISQLFSGSKWEKFIRILIMSVGISLLAYLILEVINQKNIMVIVSNHFPLILVMLSATCTAIFFRQASNLLANLREIIGKG